MEHLNTSEQVICEELLNEDDFGSLKKGHCIICLKKVKWKTIDLSRYAEEEQGDQQSQSLPEDATKSVVRGPGFLRTFNEIWAILKNKNNGIGGSSWASGDDEDQISVETVIRGGLGSMVTFSETPTFCQLCCDKVVAVENLMKAVRQQVREIKMLAEQSKSRRDHLEDFHNELDTGQSEEYVADIEVKDEEEVKTWEGSPSSKRQKLTVAVYFEEHVANSNVKPDLRSTVEDELEMECDEDLPNSVDDPSENATIGDDMAENLEEDEEDDSNWEWDDNDEDPVYIKSENGSDDEEDDESSSDEKMEEEPLTIVGSQNVPIISKDPLEIPLPTMKPKLSSLDEKSRNSMGPSENQISCDVKECPLKFSSKYTLNKHKKKCHSSSISKSGKFRNSSGSSAPKMFTCDLQGCTRSLPTEESLRRHKLSCHTEIMNELAKLDPQNKFPCSCGKVFPSHCRRYNHQRKNRATHPEFEFKVREIRNQLVDGQLCDFCGEPVKLKNILEHLANHVGAEYVVKCPNFEECGNAFTHSKDLQEKHISQKRYANCKKICEEIKLGLKCYTCDYTADYRLKLPTHVANEHERGTLPKNLKCPISSCEKMFAVKQSIFLHLHEHRNIRKTRQNCDKCGRDVKVEEIEGHLKDKHGIEDVVPCKYCHLKFSCGEEMVEHLWEHRYTGLPCDICGDDKPVKFLKYVDFREHYFGVHNLWPKRYKCGNCKNKCYWRRAELTKHKSEFHNKNEESLGEKWKKEKIYKCDKCDASYSRSISLISHKIRLHGEDPFKCDICGETFSYKPLFSRHKKEHAGMSFQEEWKCEVEGCGKIFKKKELLKKHVAVHGTVKAHICEECGKGFSFAQGLKAHHEVVHLGIRKLVCDHCGESFASGTSLKTHKLIHTGERPFACEVCGQRFRHKGVLARHMKSHEEKGADFKPNGPMKQIRKRKGQ